MRNLRPEDIAKANKAAASRVNDLSKPVGTTEQVEFNKITGQVRYDAKRRGYQVLIEYSHSDHNKTKMEASQRLFNNPREAETIATQVVQDIRRSM